MYDFDFDSVFEELKLILVGSIAGFVFVFIVLNNIV